MIFFLICDSGWARYTGIFFYFHSREKFQFDIAYCRLLLLKISARVGYFFAMKILMLCYLFWCYLEPLKTLNIQNSSIAL